MRDQEEERSQADRTDASLLLQMVEQPPERCQRRRDVVVVDVIEPLAIDASLDVHQPHQLGVLVSGHGAQR